MKELFNTILFEPLYNALILLIDVVPFADVGIAVVILTVIVKLVLFPLSIKAVRTQVKMKTLQGPINELREKYKDDRQLQGQKMLELYREHNLNPFSGFLTILIQIPVILALYWVFLRGGFPAIQTDIVYSFVKIPEMMNVHFLGLFDVTENKNVVMALLAAGTQFFQAKYAFPKPEPKKEGEKNTFQDDLARTMSVQIKYVMPIIVFFIAFSLVSVISIYWTVSNLFAIGQEVYVRNKVRNKES